jgi:hypothetical protein
MNPTSALNRLAASKTTYGPGCGTARLALVRAVGRARFRTAAQVRLLHELLCFLHAYPDDAGVFAEVDRQLRAFHQRQDLRRVAGTLVNSGIAGTDIVYPFGFSTARWLAERWGDRLTIAWDDLGHAAALDTRLHLFSLWGERPVFDEPPLEGRAWLDRLRGRETDAAFVIRRSEAVLSHDLTGDYMYDELGLTVRVAPGETTPRRTGARVTGRAVTGQNRPLRTVRPDLRADIRIPPRRIRTLGEAQATAYLDLARASMVTRSRDLYTFTAANLRDARLVDCGDGLEFFLVGVDPEQRLLFDAVYGILTLRNGVPIGYALFSALWRSSEVAYNVFETFRGGESAWVYGRMLATIHALFGADTFTIDPYQVGHENEEGIESGAWWFYYKLGFLPWDRKTAARAAREAARVKQRSGYRTSEATLRELVRTNLFLQAGPRRRDVLGAIPVDAIGGQVTDLVVSRFGSDRELATEALADEAAYRLGGVAWRRLPAGARLFWERWAPIVALLPEIDGWSADEKRALVDVIKAKGGRRESDFVARFDAHPRLGAALAALARRRP